MFPIIKQLSKFQVENWRHWQTKVVKIPSSHTLWLQVFIHVQNILIVQTFGIKLINNIDKLKAICETSWITGPQIFQSQSTSEFCIHDFILPGMIPSEGMSLVNLYTNCTHSLKTWLDNLLRKEAPTTNPL